MVEEFYKRIRRRDYRGAFRAVSSAPPRFTEPPPVPPTAHSKALLQRHHIHLLIERGLSDFRSRLDAGEWRQVQEELRMFDPGLRGLLLYITELIATTRRVALENGGSCGVGTLLEAVSFHTWANTLIEALEKYRRDCEALHHR